MHCCEFLDSHLKLNDCIRVNFKEKEVALSLFFFYVITAWVGTNRSVRNDVILRGISTLTTEGGERERELYSRANLPSGN